ncbi:MAG: hypothetical protein WD065_17205 [Planctomycetaceae bacterium]
MAIPEFTDSGDLPVGIHRALLKEAIDRLGKETSIRKHLARRLERIYQIALNTGHLRHFVIFGSFVTSKLEPNDVDVFMIMDNNFEYRTLTGESALLFNHQTADSHFGCSIFWTRQSAAFGGEQQAMEDWQIKRDGTLRGIVEISGE